MASKNTMKANTHGTSADDGLKVGVVQRSAARPNESGNTIRRTRCTRGTKRGQCESGLTASVKMISAPSRVMQASVTAISITTCAAHRQRKDLNAKLRQKKQPGLSLII